MPYTFEDFKRDYVLEHIHKLPLDDRLKGLSAEQRFKGLSRKDVPALKKQLSLLSPEERKALLDDLLKSDT